MPVPAPPYNGRVTTAPEHKSTLELREEAPLHAFTSLKAGGSVRVLATARDEEALRRALALARERALPYVVLGAGSNVLVPDGLLEAVVIRLAGSYRDIAIDGTVATAGAAAKTGQVARRLQKEGLAGFAFAAGIPGTIGGAVVMNAGYSSRSMQDVLLDVRLLAPDGSIGVATREELGLAYRTSRLRSSAEIVLEARISLEHGDPGAIAEEIRRGDEHRARTQPLDAPSCGSVFKNPAGDHAGRLIEAAGLKGTRIGGAVVSSVHANFFVTQPGSPASDVLRLVELVRERVLAASGVELEPEVIRLEESLHHPRGGSA